MKYKRILLKLSGEALAGQAGSGFDPVTISDFADEIIEVANTGIEIGIVIGGGNLFRGISGSQHGFDRVKGDYMGMLATIMNSMALQDFLQKKGAKCKILSGIPVDRIAEPVTRGKADEYFAKGYILLLAGGTGNPFFTTDSAAALRASEIKADVLLKGTRVDGVYSADPEKHPDAIKYESLSFSEAYEKNLQIMDLTAFTLCRDNKIPLIVFNMNRKGNMLKIIKGENTGTLVRP